MVQARSANIVCVSFDRLCEPLSKTRVPSSDVGMTFAGSQHVAKIAQSHVCFSCVAYHSGPQRLMTGCTKALPSNDNLSWPCSCLHIKCYPFTR